MVEKSSNDEADALSKIMTHLVSAEILLATMQLTQGQFRQIHNATARIIKSALNRTIEEDS